MTFIASVVAKKGVAIVADSLVTSQMPILHYSQFLDFLNEQTADENNQILLDPNKILPLFNVEPIFTKDYEEKLFRLNKFTAITTTGIAEINDKVIDDIVREFIGIQQHDIEDFAIPIETKIDQFKEYVITQIKEHLIKYQRIGTCTFIITFYETGTHKTHIYKLTTAETDQDALDQDEFAYLSMRKEPEWIKVICDGQNKLSDKILYGMGKALSDIFPIFIQKVMNVMELPNEAYTSELLDKFLKDDYISNLFCSDMELLNLSELSVQQAVDLASLLIRLEVDFQKYTKNIPTVGGVIKLAKIDNEGFEFISGRAIEKPKHII